MNNTNNIDTLLKVAVKDIKTAILQSQYRAAKVVNREQLSLYFGIGKYVSENSRKRFWGTGAREYQFTITKRIAWVERIWRKESEKYARFL